MIVDLDSPSGLDPVRVGGKAAALAAARAAGATVLPGFVVDAAGSADHMRLGTQTLAERGSGGARLAVSGAPLRFADELIEAGASLGERLVARSSTLLETSGAWSGAFASYVDIRPLDLPKAVVGCWSSAFTVAALDRQEAAGVEPGSFPMSVLVQPVIDPVAGGWAEKDAAGVVTVHGIKGPPAPLLQGWVTGLSARMEDTWSGDELIELVGPTQLAEIGALLALVEEATGGNRCEWALHDGIWILQVGRNDSEPETRPNLPAGIDVPPRLVEFARTLVLAPGPLGERLVYPWALGGMPDVEPALVPPGPGVLKRAEELSSELTEQVWNLPEERAIAETRQLMTALTGGEVEEAVTAIERLDPPDPTNVTTLLGCLRALRNELADLGVVPDERDVWHLDVAAVDRALDGEPVTVPPRLGIGRWEPLVAWIVLSAGDRREGTPASAGVGAGRRVDVANPYQRRTDRRGVVTAEQPLPNLASLLWDAAGLVTASGSPAAHLFESARALRLPAVCGVELDSGRDQIVAVDGDYGKVGTLDIMRGI